MFLDWDIELEAVAYKKCCRGKGESSEESE